MQSNIGKKLGELVCSEAVAAERGQAIARTLAEQAVNGDMAAIRLILETERRVAEDGGFYIPFIVEHVVVDDNGEVC